MLVVDVAQAFRASRSLAEAKDVFLRAAEAHRQADRYCKHITIDSIDKGYQWVSTLLY